MPSNLSSSVSLSSIVLKSEEGGGGCRCGCISGCLFLRRGLGEGRERVDVCDEDIAVVVAVAIVTADCL